MGKTACRLAFVLVAALPACSPLIRGTDGVSADAGRRRALEYGAQALEDRDYRVAMERIAPVAAICPTDALGRSAMLLLATAELDPRNPAGRPDAAAELAAFQLSRREEGEWEGALAAQLYTLALDYGATPIATSDIPDERVIWERYLAALDVAATPLGADTGAETPTPTAMADDARADATTRQVVAHAEGGPVCDVRDADDDVVLPELGREPLAMRSAPTPAAPAGQPAPAGDASTRELQAEIDRLRAELERKDQELDRIRRTLRP